MKPLAVTAAMLAFACAVTMALAQDAPQPEPKPQPAPKELTRAERDTLATRAYFVLRNRCWGCHGEPGKTAYGETVALDWILDYDKLVEAKLVIPGKVKESRLIYLITLGKMPREFGAEGKPSKEGELPQAEQEALTAWVKAGAPKWPEMTFSHEWVPEDTAAWPDDVQPGPLFAGPDGNPLLMWVENWRLKMAARDGGSWKALDNPKDAPTSLPLAVLPLPGQGKLFAVFSASRMDSGGSTWADIWDGKQWQLAPNARRRVLAQERGNAVLTMADDGKQPRFMPSTLIPDDRKLQPVVSKQTYVFQGDELTEAKEVEFPTGWVPQQSVYTDRGRTLAVAKQTGKLPQLKVFEFKAEAWLPLGHETAAPLQHSYVHYAWDAATSTLWCVPYFGESEVLVWQDGAWTRGTLFGAPTLEGKYAPTFDPQTKSPWIIAGQRSSDGAPRYETWALIPWRKSK